MGWWPKPASSGVILTSSAVEGGHGQELGCPQIKGFYMALVIQNGMGMIQGSLRSIKGVCKAASAGVKLREPGPLAWTGRDW